MIVVFVCSVFCLLTGGIIGYLAFVMPKLLSLLDSILIFIRSSEAEVRATRYAMQQLLALQQAVDKDSGMLAPGVYEELPDGRLVNASTLGNNGSVLPGGQLSAAGIRPSQIQP